jgi:hypothetical protein
MHTALPRYRRPRNPRLRRALLVAGLGLVACVAFEGAGSGRALALTESIREVPPLVGFMTGQVELSSDGGTTWATPPSESRVPRLSLVRTGSDGSCILVFEDRSLVAMRPGTTIQILPQAQELRLSVLAGEVWVRFDYTVENDRNGVALPQATVLALGAGSFSFEATRSTSVVKVIEGAVAAAAPKSGAPRVNFVAGQALTAGPDGLLPAIAFDVGLERTGWQPLLALAGLSVTTTTLATTTTSRPLPPDGPVGIPAGAVVVLTALGCAALAVLAIAGTFIYLGVNRRNRRRRSGR